MRPETMEDENKKVEHRAYARGYQAGRKKAKIERTADQVQKERQAFLDKAFLAVLPFAMTQTTWTIGDKPISTAEERVELAWRTAVRALKQRRFA